MKYHSFIKGISSYLIKKAGLPKENEPILTYAIEALVTSMVNITTIVFLGTLLGVLHGTIACLITGLLLRHTAGGAHSRSPWRCAAITVTIYPLMAISASYLIINQIFADVLSALIIMKGFITAIKLAPVDSEAAPIVSPLRRKKLKTISLIVLANMSLSILIMRWTNWTHAVEIQLCIVFTILWVSFMLTPYGHRLMHIIDGIYSNKKR